MKVEVTRKAIANAYFCKTVGYCDLQYLFRGVEPNFYTHGIYGWNFDAYTYGNKCVTTGYRNMIGDRIPREIVEKYEEAAKNIWNYENKATYDEKAEAAENLRREFWKEAF